MVDKIKLLITCGLLIALLTEYGSAQTTGKIAGTVFDGDSGDPLIGANVIVSDTHLGAAVSADGSFYIINVPPGTYTVRVQMMGYETMVFNDVRVSVNRTTELTARLRLAVIEGSEVVVTASALEIRKDQTSSVRNVSSETIENLAIESVGEVVNMQAGVVEGHFRGGRITEVSYMIDGIQVDESFTGTGSSVSLEAEAVEDLEVITGTFNAEYGRAMSGVVNAVTKEGGNSFHGAASLNYANFYTTHNDIFIGVNDTPALNLSQDYKFQLEGPIIRDKLSFFVNYRYQDLKGHLNGIRRFNPIDFSSYTSMNPEEWHVENTGDNKYVPMSWSKNTSLMAKMAFRPLNNIKITGLFNLNDERGQNYNHYRKYNPDGRAVSYNTSYLTALTLNHMIAPPLFYEFKASYVNNFSVAYLYENALDERYLHQRYSGTGQTGFATGGTDDPSRGMSLFEDINLKFDLTWQATTHHSLKTGVHYIDHHIDQDAINVRNKYAGLPEENISIMDSTGKVIWPFYELEIVPHTERTMGIYKVDPWELSGYLQDKLEYDNMVINIGMRYDYFNSDQVYPTNRRNPSNQLSLPDSMMTLYSGAAPQTQLSPRLGLAYQLGEAAILRFSYGHFFQMPPMYSLYENNIFRVPVNDFGTTMGNAQLHPQKTVSYEIGVWQELMSGMGLEVALFYKDIYDLLSTGIISTYNQIEYGLYTNKDYGNARGLEVKWDFKWAGFFSNVNYTLLYTKGNADNPTQTFTRAGSSMDPIKRFIPMSWDQRHTANITVGYAHHDFRATLTGYYNSGTPYTFAPLPESTLSLINLYMNNDYMPGGFKVDMTAFYDIKLAGPYDVRLTLTVYNLLDRLNPVWVYSDTGQPYTTIVREAEIASHRSNFNDYYDRVHNPTAFSAPRQIKLGLGIVF